MFSVYGNVVHSRGAEMFVRAMKLLRRGWPRYVVLGGSLLLGLLYLYSTWTTGSSNSIPTGAALTALNKPSNLPANNLEPNNNNSLWGSIFGTIKSPAPEWDGGQSEVTPDVCPALTQTPADIDTVQLYPTLDFQGSWISGKEFWDRNFEDRYLQRREKWSQLPLKVIAMPHSHNDPGWLKSFEGYYVEQTSHILNFMVEKLQAFPNMTFIWSEVSYLAKWWDSAHPSKKRVVQELIEAGKLEITTGGWIMTDEANVHLYSMLDQLIEGNQWLKQNLGVEPSSSWSIDPFGHGNTFPYLLKGAGIENMVIQRIHYGWKQWFAIHQSGDFFWRQNWDSNGDTDIFCHNSPYDIYSIKHTCGPHPQICLNFDFRKLDHEFTEYSMITVPITASNVKEKAELLLEQYGRTGSLYPHNVVLVPIGDDFRYDHSQEWDQQYVNYNFLFDYINNHSSVYHAQVKFGTLKDYFEEVRKRMSDKLPTLKGDFHTYSDIFTEGVPEYWSGYFTTRPYMKMLARQLEMHLRHAEILYSLSLNQARQLGLNRTTQVMERDYEGLTKARQSMALFQHHDAITGTAKAFVMHDYGLKMFDALQEVYKIQSRSIQALLVKPSLSKAGSAPSAAPWANNQRLLYLHDFDQMSYGEPQLKLPVFVPANEARRIVLFNSHLHTRQEMVRILVQNSSIEVLDDNDKKVSHQLNPVWNDTHRGMVVLTTEFELIFIVHLPPLSVSTYRINAKDKRMAAENPQPETYSTVYTNEKTDNSHSKSCFKVKPVLKGDIQLENHAIKLLVDGTTGLLKVITTKKNHVKTPFGLKFLAYRSAQGHSGAYLFKPDMDSREPLQDMVKDITPRVFIISGQLVSEITVMYNNFLMYTLRLFHVEGPLSEGVYMENVVNFPPMPHFRDTELIMRFVTDIDNGNDCVWYCDSAGFQMQERRKVGKIGVEGNYYPLTSMAFIQDSERRFTLAVSHAHGAASWQPGYLEVMIDRRTIYDDARGMGEGVTDNRRTASSFWILVEDSQKPSPTPAATKSNEKPYSRPSLLANYLSTTLNYPALLLTLEQGTVAEEELYSRVLFLNKPFPCDLNLLSLRTMPEHGFYNIPSSNALMILHRPGYSCLYPSNISQCSLKKPPDIHKGTRLKGVKVHQMQKCSLTGLRQWGEVLNFDEITVDAMDIKAYNLTFTR